MLILSALLLCLIILQWIGYYLAKKKADRRYRWGMFWGTMILYYLILFIAYGRAAAYYDGRQQCGMWVIGYWLMGFTGLVMPFTQLIFTILDTVIARRFAGSKVDALTEE